MSVLVSGATSQIGRYLLARLSLAGIPVLAVSRRPQPRLPGGEWWVGDLTDAQAALAGRTWQAIVSFSPMEGWTSWLAAHDHAPAPCIIATSSMSVVTKASSAQNDEQAVVEWLRRGETGLTAQATRLGMRWTILRPTLIYGAGIDKSLTPIVERARRVHMFPLPLAHGMRQPVHADDIAQAVMAALTREAAAGQTLEIGGGERLDYASMFKRVHASMLERTLPLPVPLPLLRCLAAAWPKARGPVSRLQQDLIADNGPLLALLGIQPRPFRPDGHTWLPMSPEQAMARVRPESV